MGGGLMQLVAYGAQDIYLTGNPQITFWKVVYRRCTNFAIESVEQTFMGNATPGSRATATISRNGDLVSNCVLEVDVTARSGLIATGNAIQQTKLEKGGMYNLVESVEVEIGGQKIDKHYGAWMEIWCELSCPHCGPKGDDSEQVQSGKGKVVGHTSTALTTAYATPSGAGGADVKVSASHTFYVPLCFWFNRNPGLALPLIALQYHEVKFNFQFSSVANLFTGEITVYDSKATDNLHNAATGAAAGVVNSIKMYVDYIYLDTEERRRFAQQSHEYLIDQVQYTGAVSRTAAQNASQSLRLDFNHPCKELVWVERKTAAGAGLCDFDTIGAQGGSALLQLNGHDRFAKRPMNYFTRVQTMQHHTNVPFGDRIGVYSFGLRPEDHQPSGTCNFSRIDNATLQLKFGGADNTSELQVYATNYNVLRIMSGMGGLAYSN